MNITHKHAFLQFSLSLFLVTGAFAQSYVSSAHQSQITGHVGEYTAPPRGIQRLRVGVPPFEKDFRSGAVEEMTFVAADQATTLLSNTGRFVVIERSQINQLIREQKLRGVVKTKEAAQSKNLRGVDYLLIGRVTSFRVQASQSSRNFGIGRTLIPFGGAFGAFDFKNRNSRIDVECGIDLRLVDPSTGEIVAAQFSEYNRTDTISSFNIQVLGVTAGDKPNLQLREGDQGRILRLAIDAALYKMLPQIDSYLLTR